MLSLASNCNTIIMDDELNILPTSTHVKDIQPIERGADGTALLPSTALGPAAELKDLAVSLQDTLVSLYGTYMMPGGPA